VSVSGGPPEANMRHSLILEKSLKGLRINAKYDEDGAYV
jgi:hypothetical protein